jgi:hypothetical protein
MSSHEDTDHIQKPSLFRRSAFFWISLAAHGALVLIAGVLVVQSIGFNRNPTFEAANKAPQVSTRALEYKVASPSNSSSSPALAKRIAAKGSSSIALPEIPAMPDISDVTPVSMPGLSSGGLGFGFGNGIGSGSGSGNGTGTAGRISLFGSNTRNAKGLVGYLYDIKQTKDRAPSGANFEGVVLEFVRKKFDESVLAPFYKSPPLFATQILMPAMSAEEGPKAFGVEKDVQPTQWVVHYKGKVSPPRSSTIHFVGCGDDVLFVKFNGEVVLDRCWHIDSGLKPEASYDYSTFGFPKGGLAKSKGIPVMQGKSYDMEVLIGEQPGVGFHAVLLIEEDGVSYKKDAKVNSPILPVFRLTAGGKGPKEGDILPPLHKGGPVWSTQGAGSGPSLSPVDSINKIDRF